MNASGTANHETRCGVLFPVSVSSSMYTCAVAFIVTVSARAVDHGCIVGVDFFFFFSFVIVQQGESEIPRLTDHVLPK